MLNTEAESVEDIVAASRNEASTESSMFIPDSIARQKMNPPVRSVVIRSATVERRSPGMAIGFISVNFVSIPPVKRIMLNAIMPMNWALLGELNSRPNPSHPNSIPTRRKRRRVGTPKRNPVLLMMMLTNTRTAPKRSIFSLVNIIRQIFMKQEPPAFQSNKFTKNMFETQYAGNVNL